MIDCDGFRPNVGLILCNSDRLVFWGKRVGQDAWQFPQGGIHEHESPEQAALRELQEETGLRPEHVRILGVTKRWYRYRLPSRMVRRGSHPVCIGQKQRWYLLELLGDDQSFALDASDQPEFDDWRWIDYWRPSREVVYFKREVYRRALCELAPLMFPEAVRAFRRARDELVTQGGGVSAAADRDV